MSKFAAFFMLYIQFRHFLGNQTSTSRKKTNHKAKEISKSTNLSQMEPDSHANNTDESEASHLLALHRNPEEAPNWGA